MTNFDPVSYLTHALDGADVILSSEAARLSGAFRIEESIPLLQRHVIQSRSYTKTAAIHALGFLGGDGTADTLEQVFWQPNVPDDFYWYGFRSVRTAAAIELARLGNPAGQEWLSERWIAGDPVMTRWFAPTILRMPLTTPIRKHYTAEALCVPQLRKACDTPTYTDPAMLCLLCEALGLIEEACTQEMLESYLEFHSRFVRLQAALALCRGNLSDGSLAKIRSTAEKYGTDCDRIGWFVASGDPSGLKQIGHSAISEVDRAAALDALSTWFPKEASEALLAGVRDDAPYVRRSALEALAKMHPEHCENAAEGMEDREEDPFVLCTLAAIHLQGGRRVC